VLVGPRRRRFLFFSFFGGGAKRKSPPPPPNSSNTEIRVEEYENLLGTSGTRIRQRRAKTDGAPLAVPSRRLLRAGPRRGACWPGQRGAPNKDSPLAVGVATIRYDLVGSLPRGYNNVVLVGRCFQRSLRSWAMATSFVASGFCYYFFSFVRCIAMVPLFFVRAHPPLHPQKERGEKTPSSSGGVRVDMRAINRSKRCVVSPIVPLLCSQHRPYSDLRGSGDLDWVGLAENTVGSLV